MIVNLCLNFASYPFAMPDAPNAVKIKDFKSTAKKGHQVRI